MGEIVKVDSLGKRLSRHGSALQAAVFLTVVGLALAGGGYSDTALGVTTTIAWALVVIVALARPGGPPSPPPATLVAVLLLGAMLALTALSLGWGTDDGRGFTEVVRLAGYLGVFVVVGFGAPRGSGRAILVAVVLGVIAVSLISLGSRLGGLGSGDYGLAQALPLASGRLSYPLGYWNALGALMALALPPIVHFAAEPRQHQRVNGLWLAAAAPILLTAFLTSSRGALVAALLGAAVVIVLAPERARALATIGVAIGVALPSIIAAAAQGSITETPGTGAPGGGELVVIACLLAGAAIALIAGPKLVRLLEGLLRPAGRSAGRPAVVIPVLLVLVAGSVALVGPSRLIDDFNTLPEEAQTGDDAGILSTSGSGRPQFWGTAIEAFADEPLRGVGAGGFAAYWNRNGSLGTPTRNAHSEPLELLAELGFAGFACFVALLSVIGVAAVGRARSPTGGPAGAALGLLTAGLVGLMIDWTWEIPAITVPLLIVGAGLTGPAFLPEVRSPAADPNARAAQRRPLGARLPAPLLAVAMVAIAIPMLWAGGTLAVASAKLEESRDALAENDANRAAAAARAAIAIEPWAAEPWLQLGEVERQVDNTRAALRAGGKAAELAPDDLRVWLLLLTLQVEAGNPEVAVNYSSRMAELAPLLLRRIPEFVR